jgi:hypothetical protein
MTEAKGWVADLLEVIALNKSVKPAEAEERLGRIIRECPSAELRALDIQVTEALASFLPKRRLRLTVILKQRLETQAKPEPASASESPPTKVGLEKAAVAPEDGIPDAETSRERAKTVMGMPSAGTKGAARAKAATVETQTGAASAAQTRAAEPSLGTAGQAPLKRAAPAKARDPGQLPYLKKRFANDLDELSRLRIFQWATFYRDTLSEYFDGFLEYLESDDRPNQLLNLVKSALTLHARDIYGKGYAYVTAHTAPDSRFAITKSLTGLQRFLDLPLEFYSARLAEAHYDGVTVQLRNLCSAMLFGILNGYAQTRFDQPGSRLLPRNPGSWAHVLPFLTARDLRELVMVLAPGDFTDGVQDSILPLVQALDMFLEKDQESAPLPALSQYDPSARRLDVSLQMPPNANGSRLIEIQCYTSAQFVDRNALEEAAARAISVVVAPLRPDLRGLVAAVERLNDLVLPTGGHETEPHTRLLAVLEQLDEDKSTSPNRPISYNFAAKFPLEDPDLIKYRHVYRVSVRRLMQSRERRNGARLWCSVRRSGKTTACSSDLGSATGQSVIIPQTCESTGQILDGGIFYKKVQRALVSGERLDSEFVVRTVTECLPGESAPDTRMVLVLDEYETLFGDLRTSLISRPELRYTVVQPLLNQLVTFSRENVLIFMGQQPNAHYILMDQNQLSPVIEQDSFPLFTHEPASPSAGEFYDLMRNVMTRHFELDPDFVNSVYDETSGHPFLTVKLLISFMDWLIAGGRPVSLLSPVRPELFADFTRSGLNRTAILHNPHYDMFKAAASSHLSPEGRSSDPWLHSVYSAMRSLALSSPESLTLSLDDYVATAARDCVGTSPHELLSTATRANFLTFDGAVVRPRIPLLARIASAVTPH